MNMEQWWNDDDRWKSEYSKKYLTQVHDWTGLTCDRKFVFANVKSCVDLFYQLLLLLLLLLLNEARINCEQVTTRLLRHWVMQAAFRFTLKIVHHQKQ
jgi:hypothetical protein